MANLMNHYSDNRIEVFRQTVERLGMLTGQLQTLEVTLARAKELPDLIARTSHPIQREFLKEEQAIIGHPAGLLIRCLQLDRELRQGFSTIADLMNAALDAAKIRVISLVGSAQSAIAHTLSRLILAELEQHRVTQFATDCTTTHLALIRSAWNAIDSALVSLNEIFYNERRPEVFQTMVVTTTP